MSGRQHRFFSFCVRSGTFCGGGAIVLLVLSSSPQVQAAAIYQIDINRSSTSVTEAGWTGLEVDTTSATTANASLVVVDDITFQIFSADGSRLRGTVGAPNPNALTGDFAFDDNEAGSAVGLRFGSSTATQTGTLAAGPWKVEVWIYDSGAFIGTQIVGYETRTNNITQPNTTVSSAVTPHATDPAITYEFDADGLSYYSVFVRENNAENRSRLNAVRLTHLIPEPTSIALLLVGVTALVGLIRR